MQAFTIDSLEFDAPELEKRFADFDADHHEAMYAAWRDSFPVEGCWPELGKK